MSIFDSKNNKEEKVLSPEDEIKELERLLASKKEQLIKGKSVEEKKEAAPSEAPEELKETKEAWRETIKEKVKIKPPPIEKKGVSISRPPAVLAQISDDVMKIKQLEVEQQVKKLTELAFHQGIHYAIDVARNIDDPYLIDRFHDALVNELYQNLVQTKKLKQL